ncbi:MAG: isoprenylcysteine carboxylmethyltransferase family protein [Anaerolineales bacterium]
MVNFLAWIFFSILLLVFTIIRTHPYRFTRFLAFESLLGLIFLNADSWFVDSFSVRQLFSWVFLAGSIIVVGQGFYLIKTKGNPAGDFEDTTQLITSGVFHYIRHPLYSSLILFGFGVALKDPSLLGGALLLLVVFGVALTARIEERHNLERFGEEYQRYCKNTKRFIPFIY